MKSSIVLVIVFFVIMVAATVIAKLASEIQLAPKRPPLIEADNSQPLVPLIPADPEPPRQIDIEAALHEELLTVTVDNATTLSIKPTDPDALPEQTLVVSMGTAFGVDESTCLFIAYPTQEFADGNDNLSISVLPCHVESARSAEQNLQVVADKIQWGDLVQTKSFRLASPQVRQYAIWTVAQNIRLKDLQPLLKSPSSDARLPVKSIAEDERDALIGVLTASGLVNPSNVPLLDDLYNHQRESDAVAAIHEAYQAFDSGDADLLTAALNDVKQATSEFEPGSLITMEAAGLELLFALKSLTQPNLQSLPAVVAQKVDEVIERLRSDNYPVDDLESRHQLALQAALNRCLDQALLGQVRELADRIKNNTVSTDLITRLRSAEHDFLGIFERQLAELEDEEILADSIVDQARLMFVPDDAALRRLNAMSSVPLDDIPKSKQRDTVRQLSVLYVELAEAAVKSELPELAKRFANQTVSQEIKAPGVNSRAQRILRTLESDTVE